MPDGERVASTVGVAAQPVDEPGHAVHGVERAAAEVDDVGDLGQEAHGGVEAVGVVEVRAQLLVVLVDDGGDGVGAGIGADDAHREPTAEPDAEPEVVLVLGAVPAREVDDTGVALGLVDGDAVPGKPRGRSLRRPVLAITRSASMVAPPRVARR